MKSNLFTASYYQTSKPKGVRGSNIAYNYRSFEEVLLSVLEYLCEKIYNDKDSCVLEILIIKPISCNRLRCEYSVKFPDEINRDTILRDYIIQIECDFDNDFDDVLEPNDSLDFMREEKVIEKKEKDKNPTKWFINESMQLNFFYFNWMSLKI